MSIEKSRYQKLFLSESKENLQLMNNSLLNLEKKPNELKSVSEFFRAIHSLKSMAATMGYNKMAELCHKMEDILADIKNKERILTPDLAELFFLCIDSLELTIKKIAKGDDEDSFGNLLSKLKLSQPVKEDLTNQGDEQDSVQETKETIEKIDSIKVNVGTLDTLMNLMEELLVSKMRLDQVHESKQTEEMDSVLDDLGRLVSDLQLNILKARLVPVEQIFYRFPRMVRDLAKKQKKQVNLVIEGQDIELDRTIIEKLGEPVLHLLRNAVDHGIEIPEVRKKRNKPETGTIKLVAKRERGLVIIEVEDDGNGIDLKKNLDVALKTKIITKNQAAKLDDEKAKDLLFQPGFTTTEKVTEVSGRGVGLNVVKTMVDALGGTIKVDSHFEKGMKISLELPLSLAIIRALIIKVGEEMYAIPLVNVDRLVRVNKENIRGVINQEIAVLPKANVPLLRLYNLFNIPHEKEEDALLVIVKKDKELVGLAVDSLVDEQDIIVKPLDRLLKQNKAFSGLTILAEGNAALILDVANLS